MRRKAIAYLVSLLVLACAVWGPAPILAQALPGGGIAGGDGGGITFPVADTIFKVCDDGDSTKCWNMQLSGITTANTVAPIVLTGTAAAPLTNISGQILIFGSWNVNGAGDLVGLNTGKLGFISAGGTGFAAVGDAYFMRDGAAASLQMGADINGAAVNQSLSAGDGITGTDILGSGLTVSAGLGTGAAVSNPYSVNRQITKATGTTAQTAAPAEIVCPSKILSNTSATTTTVATITTATTSGGNVTMDYGTLACSGSTCDADGGIVKVAWNNNAGTVAAAMTAVVAQADSDATGNITTGGTVTAATNVVSVKVTPVFTTIVPTSVIFTASFIVHSAADTVVCQ